MQPQHITFHWEAITRERGRAFRPDNEPPIVATSKRSESAQAGCQDDLYRYCIYYILLHNSQSSLEFVVSKFSSLRHWIHTAPRLECNLCTVSLCVVSIVRIAAVF